jgi:hypothetical protein
MSTLHYGMTSTSWHCYMLRWRITAGMSLTGGQNLVWKHLSPRIRLTENKILEPEGKWNIGRNIHPWTTESSWTLFQMNEGTISFFGQLRRTKILIKLRVRASLSGLLSRQEVQKIYMMLAIYLRRHYICVQQKTTFVSLYNR